MMTQAAYLERLAIASDSRCQGKAEMPVLYLADGTEKPLPVRWEVCPVCEGNGSHTKPSIDANLLTGEDFDNDPDFAEDYISGKYDEECNRCDGRTTVPAVDFDRMSAEDRAAYQAQLKQEAADRAEARAEFIRGA